MKLSDNNVDALRNFLVLRRKAIMDGRHGCWSTPTNLI